MNSETIAPEVHRNRVSMHTSKAQEEARAALSIDQSNCEE